ncbi:aspartate 1-decarboxylase [bacterium]|nr:aspartate 1-decarboxylase [bacterium]
MNRTLLKSKLHRVRVTACSVDYVGSIGIDENLMDAAGIVTYEKVLVANIANGERFETYVVPEPRGSGNVNILGAAAHLAEVGDMVIIIAFASLAEHEIATHTPRIVFVDDRNQPRPA